MFILTRCMLRLGVPRVQSKNRGIISCHYKKDYTHIGKAPFYVFSSLHVFLDGLRGVGLWIDPPVKRLSECLILPSVEAQTLAAFERQCLSSLLLGVHCFLVVLRRDESLPKVVAPLLPPPLTPSLLLATIGNTPSTTRQGQRSQNQHAFLALPTSDLCHFICSRHGAPWKLLFLSSCNV